MKPFLNISLALFILLSSIGLSVYKIICQHESNVEYSFFNAENCCDEETNNCCEIPQQSNCCDFSTDYFQISFPSIVVYQFIKIAQIDLLNISKEFTIYNLQFTIYNLQFLIPPPPLLNSTSPDFTGVFRI